MAATKGPYRPINLAEQVASITKPWNPTCLLTVNDSHSFKLANFHGAFPWHSHSNTDETFMVLKGGPIEIELNTTAKTPDEAEKDGATDVVTMEKGEMFCVPKGMQHRPSAEVEAAVMMVEKVGTLNVGERTESELRVDVDESGR